MTLTNWRRELDLDIDESLTQLLNETKLYDNAISGAQDKSKAQMWVAMAILNKKLELALGNNDKKEKKKLSEKDLKKLLKALESY